MGKELAWLQQIFQFFAQPPGTNNNERQSTAANDNVENLGAPGASLAAALDDSTSIVRI
jgi:hypothetical protein